MKKVTKKMVAVTLSTMMLFEAISVAPVTAKETQVSKDSKQELSYANYPTGNIPVDISKISDDLKVNSVEEYYQSLEEEKKAEKEGSVTKAELAAGGIPLEEAQQDVVKLTKNEIAKANSNAQKAVVALPDEVDNSTSEFFPEIKLQDKNSCVAFAHVYYQFSYIMNKHLNRASTKENTFSPYFLYNFFGNNHGKNGIVSKDSFSIMKNKGCLPWDGITYDETLSDWKPNSQDWEEADNYRLKKYEYLSPNIGASGQQITSPNDSDLDTIKTALNNGEILTFSTYVYSWDINNINYSNIVPENNRFTGEEIATDITGTEGAHRMTIVGYNDNIWYDINEDGKVQEAEKGAFKIANSWGTSWGNKGYCWLSYDAINVQSAVKENESESTKNNYFDEITRIEVEDFDSDSDIKLIYTLNSKARNELSVSVSSILGKSSKTGYATPFYIYNIPYMGGNPYLEKEAFSFSGNNYAEDGTMVMDLDRVIPDINSNNFKDYYWIMNVEDKTANDNSCIIKDAKIIDYNTGKVYPVIENLPRTVNGSSADITFEKENAKGFDFKISNITYTNESRNYNSKIVAGDKIRFGAKVENVGDIKATDDNKMEVLFSVNGQNTWSDDYCNKPGLLPNSIEYLKANGGGPNGDGTMTFNEPGTYTVTAWVNDANDFPNEYGGNNAENNKTSFTFTVVENEILDVESLSISNKNPVVGEELTFEAKLRQPATVQTSLSIVNASYFPYDNIAYTDGTSLKYTFKREGIYYITFLIKDVITDEVKNANWRITVGPAEETTTIAETTTISETTTAPDMIVKSLNPSAIEITEGESIHFTVDVENASSVQTKICVANANGVYLDQGTYIDGTAVTRAFDKEGIYRVHAVVKDLATGKEVNSPGTTIVVKKKPYYDFEVTDLTYTNLTTGETGGEIHQNDKIKFCATIKNIGNIAAPDNYKMGVQFQVDGNTYNITWNDEYKNRKGLAAGESVTLTAMGGITNTDGSWTFTEDGNHSVTAWVNDTNDFADEFGGNQAANNKKTISVLVTPTGEFTVKEITASKIKMNVGDIVEFNVNVENAPLVQTKIVLFNPYSKYEPVVDESEYVDGTTVFFEMRHTGFYCAYAVVKNLITGEEKNSISTPGLYIDAAKKGFDFSITELRYSNVTTGEENGTIKVGDSIKFGALIKNIGDTISESNKKLGVQFQINGNTSDITWCDSYKNENGLGPNSDVLLWANGGNINTNGVVTFTQRGTYTITAWVNDTNDYTNEFGGNQAENNRKTITITVE